MCPPSRVVLEIYLSRHPYLESNMKFSGTLAPPENATCTPDLHLLFELNLKSQPPVSPDSGVLVSSSHVPRQLGWKNLVQGQTIATPFSSHNPKPTFCPNPVLPLWLHSPTVFICGGSIEIHAANTALGLGSSHHAHSDL